MWIRLASAFPASIALVIALAACEGEDGTPPLALQGTGGSGEGGEGAGGGASGGTGAMAAGGGGALVCARECTDCAARPSAALFGYASVPRFEFTLPPERWEYLQAHARDEVFEEACVSFEGTPIGNVGLRFKGNYGTLLGCFDAQGNMTCTKLSMKVKFSEYARDAVFYGVKRLNFHSMIWDDTKLHERVAYDLYREMGLASPRTSWALLTVNGENLGLFSMIEQVDGAFTDDRWPDAGDGNLWKEAWPTSSDPESYLAHIETNEETATADAFIRFYEALAAAPTPAERNAVLSSFMDLERFYDYMAVDDAVMDWDGITAFYTDRERSFTINHNYYLYQDPSRDHFELIPWDKDATFVPQATFSQIPRWDTLPEDCSVLYPVWGDAEAVVVAAGCDLVFQALAADRASYADAVQRLLDGPFVEAALNAKIDAGAAFISAAVAEDPLGAGLESWNSSVKKLKDGIPMLRQRLEALRDGEPIAPMTFTATGVNDLEDVGGLSAALGATLMSNANSTVAQSVNTVEPLAGLQDLRIDFEYRDEVTAWQQWIYYTIALAEGAHDMSAVTGLRLMARADQARTLRLELESPAHSAANLGVRFGWDVAVGPEPTLVEVRLADARVPSWSVDQGVDPGDPLSEVLASVTGVAFHPYCVGRDTAGFLGESATDVGFLQLDSLEFFSE